MDSNTLELSGSDIIVQDSVIDSSGNAVTAGQTVTFTIKRLSDGLYWDGADFTLGAEPAGSAASQDGTSGVYKLTLSGGWPLDYTREFQVHRAHTGAVARDFTATHILDVGFDDNQEGTTSFRQALRLASSALYGLASGFPLSGVFRDIGDTKNRLTTTTDADGNRTVVTKDAT